MLSRVRRSDVVLAAVAAVGLAAGLTLTVTSKLGVSGPFFIIVGIVAAVAAATRSFWEGAATLRARQSQQSDSLKAICRVPITPVSAVDPFKIGVFRSELAEREARGEDVPPYVPRRVDDALRRALGESLLEQTQRLVVLRGDPKSGKSRAMWEAVRILQGRKLLALVPPVVGSDTADPGYEPLSTLLKLERPVAESKGRDLVIWIDDAQLHLRHGLTRDNLRRLVERYPGLIVVLTIHSSALDGIKDFDTPLHALLRQPFDELILRPVLSPEELAAAKAAYPGLADNTDLGRLPELFAAVNLITDRYQSHWVDEPIGTAVAKAAIDWQRAGMPPGSIDRPTLRAFTNLTLREVAPNRLASDEDFDTGLRWSTAEVAAFAALLRREHTGSSDAERYRAFDAVVSWAQVNEEPLHELTWRFVLEQATDADRIQVGLTAYQGGETAIARGAFARVAASGDSTSAPVAVRHLGVLLKEQGEIDAAKAAYQQAIDSGHPDQAPAAAFNLANLLAERGEVDAAKAAYQQAIDSGHPDQAPAAAVNLGNLLAERGEVDAAKAAYQQAIGSSHPEVAPRAAVNLGNLLAELETLKLGEVPAPKAAYRLAIDSALPGARAPAVSDEIEVIDVLLTPEILRVGAQVYPLKDITQVQTVKLVPARGKALARYLIVMLLLVSLSVAVMRFAGSLSSGSSALHSVAIVVLVVILALVVISTIRLINRLSGRSFYALVIEEAGTSRTALVSIYVNELTLLRSRIMDAIDNPPASPTLFYSKMPKYHMPDKIERYRKESVD